MSPDREFSELLRRYKFTLVAENRHFKYADPEGRLIVVSKTPSDWRAYRRMIQDLKHVVANPPPSSALVEEERQRKELEQYIQLAAESQRKAGITGAGKAKSSVSRGTGIHSILVTNAETVAQREERRLRGLARAEEKREARSKREAAQSEYREQSRLATAGFLELVDEAKDMALSQIQYDKEIFLDNFDALISVTNTTKPISFPAEFSKNLVAMMTAAVRDLEDGIKDEPRLTEKDKKRGLTLWVRDQCNWARQDVQHVSAVASQCALALLTCPDNATAWLNEVKQHIKSENQAEMFVRLMRLYREIEAEADAKTKASAEVPDVQQP